ncbi:MAG: flagellar biosynthesis anti-sigma factor FlgM [Agathobacter sp.]|nr:flagellar biosynthesis anti-sigma factor FlgM [Agathobacter sp.]
MRIDAYNQIAQIYGVQKSARTARKQSAGGQSDQLSISQIGRDYQVAKAAVAEASDIREDKIARIKTMMDNGTYSVDPGAFASKLLEKYSAGII